MSVTVTGVRPVAHRFSESIPGDGRAPPLRECERDLQLQLVPFPAACEPRAALGATQLAHTCVGAIGAARISHL